MASTVSQSRQRLIRKLSDALGPNIQSALNDPSVVEVMLNPNSRIFVERIGQGVSSCGELGAEAAETVIGIVAHALNSEANHDHPIVSGELPIAGYRFEGLLPPLVGAPTFTIRKPASMVMSLAEYMGNHSITAEDAEIIRNAVVSRLNIVIAGGTGSGKTTLANAIIAEIATTAPDQRLVILEDTSEIQCAAHNVVTLHTSDSADMARLLKSTMRLRPDRIIVGEVRDGAALTLLKAWNTGHPGGVTTIHANSAISALTRLEQLVAEVSAMPMREVIGEAVDLIVAIARTPTGRRVTEILHVENYRSGSYQFEICSPDKENANVA
ncbi:P-type conjugative transfer ATPase TrbB (plasmid) [Devosia neptuniae]|uniref:P-type conjugative transfer ATPase TrbB n=1 Tax=Devosia neptuniae TaxID=191302 RepID=A0ABY6C6N7_9HYPH|nr:P-type conjugative transfer ATPase TrbB [Devosia neptuniae]UXN67923.1 P-type conjugative transfer ATPase TrbB [Devosia neptuniae]